MYTISHQHRFYVVDQDGAEIATAVVYEKQGTLWITDVWVQYNHRKNGIATSILKEVIEQYKHRDLYLGVNGYTNRPMNDEQLTEWYKSFGFVETDVPTIMKRPAGE